MHTVQTQQSKQRELVARVFSLTWPRCLSVFVGTEAQPVQTLADGLLDSAKGDDPAAAQLRLRGAALDYLRANFQAETSSADLQVAIQRLLTDGLLVAFDTGGDIQTAEGQILREHVISLAREA